MNKRFWLCAITFAGITCRPTVAAPDNGALAILTDVHGAVLITRAGKEIPGKSGARLLAGDVVHVSDGSATVFYNSRPPAALKKGQKVTVAATTTVASAGMWRNAFSGISSGFDRRAEEIPGVGTRDNNVTLIAPINSRVLTTRPVFQWIPFTQAGFEVADYEITLTDPSSTDLDAEGDVKPLWQSHTRETTLSYPADAPALTPGHKYAWRVTPRQAAAGGKAEADPDKKSRTSTIEIATPADTAAANAEIAELTTQLKDVPEGMRRTVEAAALARRGFNAEALAILTPDLANGVVEKSAYQKKLEALLPTLDDSSRVLLRTLYLDTKQADLAGIVDKQTPAAAPDGDSDKVGIGLAPDEK